MRHLDGGAFLMGSERFYREEAPVRRVRVDPFWIDETPVTNRAFARFVAETGYRTVAEVAPDPAVYADLPAELAHPGSLVFEPTRGPVDLGDPNQWWHFRLGACWRHPLGPDSDLAGIEDHPVVHIAHADAQAYADWAGKSLPTEAEWEYAARGGLDGADYAWGSELAPGGAMLANYWQGAFPFANQLLDGWERTSPVRTYAPNGYDLYDMIGNVWEWTADWFAQPRIARKAKGSCCVPNNPRGGREQDSLDPSMPVLRIGRKVLKGGSHLCAAHYCRRYRPAARLAQMIDSSTGHIGFRCVVRGMA
ncbi:formylglycine-generating enzyme family protein [Sphingomonas abietis]|uniref:Formylglycine-generating enzyme family protein n=1 Tax=Sphingomonas abietis TaxID=3012344 RepID=A0ABY7NSP2_9SPHN|nr:formylglycine-generating enzyme family protein [Sphingomonas abietis]WBO24520.1 formylglycine-generating enzyme family protein [Sphingomonas abietis]